MVYVKGKLKNFLRFFWFRFVKFQKAPVSVQTNESVVS